MNAQAFELGVVCGRCDTYSSIGTATCSSCGNDLTLEEPAAKSGQRPQAGDALAEPKPKPKPEPSPDPREITAILEDPSAPMSADPPTLRNSSPPFSMPAAEEPTEHEEVTLLYEDEVTKVMTEEESEEAAALSRRVPSVPGEQLNRFQDEEIEGGSRGSGLPPELAGLSQEELMDQAKNYVCESCMTPVPSGHKFCGRCGTPVPEHVLTLRTDYFSDMQDPTKARVVLIRGQDMEGLSYHLKADEHMVGRGGALDFSDDPFISPKHANLFYRGDKLVVRDEGSLNGVYIRVRGGVEIAPGDTFLAGEQVFRLDPTPKASDGADTDGTFFYSSPKYPSAFRLNQILQGGSLGMTVCARGNSLHIGREDGDLNFPGDVYMSAKHCSVEEKDGKYTLTDHDSRNGTYVKIKTERELDHGDFIFLGKKLLRVEMNVN